MIVPIKPYPSILNVWKRGGEKVKHNLVWGAYSIPELSMINRYHAEEKLDGEGTQITITPDQIYYNSRNGGKTRPLITCHMDSVLSPSAIRSKFDYVYNGDKPSYVKLYGEAIGKGIQEGRYYVDDIQRFNLFDVFVGDPTNKDTPIGGWWLRRINVQDIAKSLGLQTAPVVDTHMTLGRGVSLVSGGFTTLVEPMEDRTATKTREAEGLVLRTDPYIFTSKGERIMCKIKTKDMRRLKEWQSKQ